MQDCYVAEYPDVELFGIPTSHLVLGVLIELSELLSVFLL